MVLQVHVDIQNPPPGLIPFIQGNHRCPYLPSHRDQLTWKQQTTERVWVQTSWTPKLYIYIYIHVTVHEYMCICVYMCIYVYIYICIYIYMYVYISNVK